MAPKLSSSSTPLRVSRSLRLDECQNSLNYTHLLYQQLSVEWESASSVKYTVTWLDPLGHIAWKCQVHSLRLMAQEHSKGSQTLSLLAWPIFNQTPGKFYDSLEKWLLPKIKWLHPLVPIAPWLCDKHYQHDDYCPYMDHSVILSSVWLISQAPPISVKL